MTELTLLAVGDVGPNRKKPETIFANVHEHIQQADIAFCQLEPVLSNRGAPLPQSRLPMRTDPTTAKAIREAGFNVVSFASNHCMDWGSDAFFDTIKALEEQEINVIGVGQNIEDAREPAFIECKGTKVAFLGFNSILPEGYWAESDRPGCTPLRAHTLYEQIEHDQPGTPCRIHTFPHQGDLNRMIEDVKHAKTLADVVIVSMHWGIHFTPEVLADYEGEAARAAIDAGADLILGHHQHILKGIDSYKGKVIFHSLANFALESPFSFAEDLVNKSSYQDIKNMATDWEPERSPLPPDSMRTIVVKCKIANKRIEGVSYLPAYINMNCEPEILQASDERFYEVVSYVSKITESQGLNTSFQIQGNEVVLETW